jgi:uncharacterized membrane protein YfcA
MMPIAAAATFGNVVIGSWDVTLGLAVAAGLSIGTVAGATFAHVLSIERLKQFLAGTLIVVGVLIIARLGLRAAGVETF